MHEDLPCPWCDARDGYRPDSSFAGIGPGLDLPVMAYRCQACDQSVGFTHPIGGGPSAHRLTALEPITEV